MYRRAVQEDPSYSRAYNNLGRILVGRGRLDEAVVSYRKAIEAQPDFVDRGVQQLGLERVRIVEQLAREPHVTTPGRARRCD